VSAQIENRKSKINNPLSGWVLFVLLAGLLLCLGLAPEEGLILWSVVAFGLPPKFLHVVAGVLVALVLAWQLGSRKVWKGIVGIGLAVAAGGAGELAQKFLTASRTARFEDAVVTGLGACAAAVPYLLALVARWCESEDAAGQG